MSNTPAPERSWPVVFDVDAFKWLRDQKSEWDGVATDGDTTMDAEGAPTVGADGQVTTPGGLGTHLTGATGGGGPMPPIGGS